MNLETVTLFEHLRLKIDSEQHCLRELNKEIHHLKESISALNVHQSKQPYTRSSLIQQQGTETTDLERLPLPPVDININNSFFTMPSQECFSILTSRLQSLEESKKTCQQRIGSYLTEVKKFDDLVEMKR
ncbi:hypothetical protein RCL1_004018 [Eukaryota sp. TZLM3-RCL]